MRLLAILLALAAAPAAAHKPSDSYLALKVDGEQIEGQWDIALRDLDFAVGLDANADGEITWGEVKARQPAIAAYALARLALRSETAACPAGVTAHLVDDHSDGAYAVLRFVAACSGGCSLTTRIGAVIPARRRATPSAVRATHSPSHPASRAAAFAGVRPRPRNRLRSVSYSSTLASGPSTAETWIAQVGF